MKTKVALLLKGCTDENVVNSIEGVNDHSRRVAMYSRKIAKEAGMTEAECDDVYLAGLLHDVGKTKINGAIINKKGIFTIEEYVAIKQHTTLGWQILSEITSSTSLSDGARYHHERYDGNGYPDGLKADAIPRIARIIAVADAYDAMTSMRSYRDMLPKEYVREELINGLGTQFDPEYAKIMLKFLDQDVDYTMKEHRSEEVFGADLSYNFEEYKSEVSIGIRITDCPISIRLQYKPLTNEGQPTLLFYDSADAKYYLGDSLSAGEMDFVEFVSIDMNGTVNPNYIRKVQHTTTGKETITRECDKTYIADVFIVKQEDHLLVKITTEERTDEITLAMFDASRYTYLALTGESCVLDILSVEIAPNKIDDNYIHRIAEKISYINEPTGDIPNVQIDGWITNRSDIIKLDSDINLTFHTMSLPSSRRIWHCPIIGLFTSDDGNIDGANYQQLAFIRLDGEVWCDNPKITNDSRIATSEKFKNWNNWKQTNRAGVDCTLKISRQGDILELYVENSGLETYNKTKLPMDASNIYFYLTGDQCALTDIHITRE